MTTILKTVCEKKDITFIIITILKELLTHRNAYLLAQEMLHQHYILLREVSVENNLECEKISDRVFAALLSEINLGNADTREA